MSENGTEPQQDKTYTLTIQFTPNTGRVAIAVGDEPIELVVALNLLQAAYRELEADWKIQRGIAAQQQLKQQQEDNARTAAILNRTMPKFPRTQ